MDAALESIAEAEVQRARVQFLPSPLMTRTTRTTRHAALPRIKQIANGNVKRAGEFDQPNFPGERAAVAV